MEPAGIEPVADAVEIEPLHRRGEAGAQKLGDRSLAAHAQAELGLIEGAAAHLADQRQHALGAVGPVLAQPFLEQVLDLKRQAQDGEARARGTGFLCRLEDRFHLVVVQPRDHGRGHDAGRDAGRRQGADRFQPTVRRRGARLHRPRQLLVEGGHGYERLGKIALGHVA